VSIATVIVTEEQIAISILRIVELEKASSKVAGGTPLAGLSLRSA